MKTKQILCLFLCAVILFTFTGCPGPAHLLEERKSPENFPGSTWSTENGGISFYVAEEYSPRFQAYRINPDGAITYGLDRLETNVYGSILINGKEHPFFAMVVSVWGGVGFLWHLISEDMPQEGNEALLYEEIIPEFTFAILVFRYKKNRCTATVKNVSCLFENYLYEEGTEFEFFRTDI